MKITTSQKIALDAYRRALEDLRDREDAYRRALEDLRDRETNCSDLELAERQVTEAGTAVLDARADLDDTLIGEIK